MRHFLLGSVLFACSVCAAQAQQCQLREEDFVAHHLPRLTSWEAVFTSFRANVPQCDDGFFAEGYSQAVVGLLARSWTALPRFGALSQGSPQFHAFVLKHIDATTEQADLLLVKANAESRCPRTGTVLCKRIGAAASTALEQLRRSGTQ